MGAILAQDEPGAIVMEFHLAAVQRGMIQKIYELLSVVTRTKNWYKCLYNRIDILYWKTIVRVRIYTALWEQVSMPRQKHRVENNATHFRHVQGILFEYPIPISRPYNSKRVYSKRPNVYPLLQQIGYIKKKLLRCFRHVDIL